MAQGTFSLCLMTVAVTFTGCLPDDTRPTPGELSATIEGSDALTSGLDTDDGWHVRFERLLVSIGHVELDGEGCAAYSEPRYSRLVDLAAPVPRQKLSQAYGIGSCQVVFRISPVEPEDVLGLGVPETDRASMRTDGRDAHVPSGGATLLVTGAATRDSTTVMFDWAFRRSYQFKDCPTEQGSLATSVELGADANAALAIVIFGEELFRVAPNDTTGFAFDAVNRADVDADGVVTLDELAGAPPPTSPDAGGPVVTDLLGYMYEKLLPRLPHVSTGGACDEGERKERR